MAVGKIKAKGGQTVFNAKTSGDLLETMKKDARKCGADAIILGATEDRAWKAFQGGVRTGQVHGSCHPVYRRIAYGCRVMLRINLSKTRSSNHFCMRSSGLANFPTVYLLGSFMALRARPHTLLCKLTLTNQKVRNL